MKAIFPPARILNLTMIPDYVGAGEGVNEGGKRGEGRLLVGMTSAFILLDPRVPFILHAETRD